MTKSMQDAVALGATVAPATPALPRFGLGHAPTTGRHHEAEDRRLAPNFVKG